jgi:tetratricopeptide (TPR) repeat protein
MTETNSKSVVNLNFAVEGYFISPGQAAALERSLEETPQDKEARWKLLGFLFAHMLCCPQQIERRIGQIVWAIDSKQEISAGAVCLRLFPPVDEEQIAQVRAAWQRRLDANPDDPELLQCMGDFLSFVRPDDARKYLERALEIKPDNELVKMTLAYVTNVSQRSAEIRENQLKPMTCFFEVLSSIPLLLEETRLQTQHSEEALTKFSKLVNELAYQPLFLVFSQHTKEVPLDGPAIDICRQGLKQMYKAIPKQNPTGKELSDAELTELWKAAKIC